MTSTSEKAVATRCFAGIDPSLTGTGVCVLMDGEEPLIQTITTLPKTHPIIFDRLKYIVRKISDILFKDYDFGPDDVICIERPFVSPKNMNSQQSLLVLSHLIRQDLYERQMPWKNVSPMTLKKFVCGKGNAEKSMMLMRVYQHWDISANDDNQADAVGLAHMAKVMDALRGNGDRDRWPKYQLEVVKSMLAKGD